MNTILTVSELLQFAVKNYREKDFCRYIRYESVHIKTYNDFDNDCNAVCRYIQSVENRKMHIAFIGKTDYEYIACLTGMIISGNVVVPFAPDISVQEAVQLFDDADIEMLFCEEEFLEKAEAIQNAYKGLKKIISLGDNAWFADIFKNYGNEKYTFLPNVEISPDDCALIIYTSGTTGDRKGVMLSHKNLAANSTYDTYVMDDDDVSFSILPMHHVFCYACDVLKTMYDGGTLCLNGKLADLYTNILIFEPTIMRIVPAICKSMLTKIRLAERRNPSLTKREAAETVVGKNFRRMIAGSAFLSAAIIDSFEEYGIIARQGYGMTECSPRISTSDFTDKCKYSNGKLLAVDEVRVQDGEIQVKGPSVMLGYYKKPEATEAAFTSDGFLHTGDLGYLEDDHIYLVGRKKNLIILSNGENISPEEIENKFADFDIIKEMIVIAQDDEIVAQIFPDETVKLAMQVEDIEVEIERIIDRVNISLPSDRQIRRFVLREKPFERTSTGKLKRQEFYY